MERYRREDELGLEGMAARHGRSIRGLMVFRRCRGIRDLGDAIARCIERLTLTVLPEELFWRSERWKLGQF